MSPRVLSLVILLACKAAVAEPLYQVEILIFTQPPEEAPQEILQAQTPATAEETQPGAVDFGLYTCLPADADPQTPPALRSREDLENCLRGYLRLNELDQPMVQDRLLLSQSGLFRILYHSAWRQPAFPAQQAQAVRIATLQGDGDGNGNAEELSGTVRLAKEQYLQMEFLLHYRPPGAGPEDRAVLLQKNQALRSGTTYYLDDPRVGLLVRVTEVEEESPETPAS